MSSNRSSEFKIFTDSQFLNKKFEDREYSEDFLLLIAHSVSIHFLSSILAKKSQNMNFVPIWISLGEAALTTWPKAALVILPSTDAGP